MYVYTQIYTLKCDKYTSLCRESYLLFLLFPKPSEHSTFDNTLIIVVIKLSVNILAETLISVNNY